MRQMTIFDYLRQQGLEEMEAEDMARQVAERTGLTFKYNDRLTYYEAKQGKTKFTVHFSRYKVLDERNGERFIAAGWDEKMSGAGSPTDSIEEAVNYILYKINRLKEESRG